MAYRISKSLKGDKLYYIARKGKQSTVVARAETLEGLKERLAILDEQPMVKSKPKKGDKSDADGGSKKGSKRLRLKKSKK